MAMFWLPQMNTDINEAEAELAAERSQVEQLWNVMDVQEAAQAAFLSTVNGCCGPSAFAAVLTSSPSQD